MKTASADLRWAWTLAMAGESSGPTHSAHSHSTPQTGLPILTLSTLTQHTTHPVTYSGGASLGQKPNRRRLSQEPAFASSFHR